ncbi:uncharacterized protein LOC130194202 [Pseudoliparis swirei]|uniref:uncharacterized protein LOC130194202 n=1 Tax=Pseudoliparis swirei TaxID=2059687 RepID=UPI0024BE15D3|nr:uncharacterized protein LOC130194202 [Pseudoliparis swirei]
MGRLLLFLQASRTLPDPRRGAVTDIEAELLWQNRPHPPRGDVPNRRPYLDYGEVEPQDQRPMRLQPRPLPGRQLPGRVLGALGALGLQVALLPVDVVAEMFYTKLIFECFVQVHQSGERRSEEKVWTFHSLTPLRVEELKLSESGWSRSPHGRLPQDFRAGEPLQMDHPEPRRQPELLQRKTGKATSSSCPGGWTHYRRRCYIVGSSVASWASAERSCSLLLNSSLTSVRSRRDVVWLWKFTGRKPFWIGLSGGPGRWMWADGQTLSFSN